MQTNRRNWLRQMGLGVAGIGLSSFRSISMDETPPAGEADTRVRLSSNENPYGPSPMAREAMLKAVLASNRYGWDFTPELMRSIAAKHGVNEQNILANAGSTELLDMVARFASLNKGSFVIADPSYGSWTGVIVRRGMEKIAVPLTGDKKIDLAAMRNAVKPDTRLVYICNPNNPTGTLLERTALVDFVNEVSKKTLVMVDEAYLDFTSEVSLGAIAAGNPNLVVVKTFSKVYGLAGARIGYLVGHESTVKQVASLQTWNNGDISVASAAAAIASLKDEQFVRDTVRKNEAARAYTIEQLRKHNIRCIPSHTNFIYFSVDGYPKDYSRQLSAHNISGTGIFEQDGKWTRITVGTMEEMEKFVAAIV